MFIKRKRWDGNYEYITGEELWKERRQLIEWILFFIVGAVIYFLACVIIGFCGRQINAFTEFIGVGPVFESLVEGPAQEHSIPDSLPAANDSSGESVEAVENTEKPVDNETPAPVETITANTSAQYQPVPDSYGRYRKDEFFSKYIFKESLPINAYGDLIKFLEQHRGKSSAPSSVVAPAVQYLKEIYANNRSGLFQSAEDEFRDLVYRYPQDGFLRRAHGLTLLKLGDNRQALDEVQSAVILDPTDAFNWDSLADICNLNGMSKCVENAKGVRDWIRSGN